MRINCEHFVSLVGSAAVATVWLVKKALIICDVVPHGGRLFSPGFVNGSGVPENVKHHMKSLRIVNNLVNKRNDNPLLC